MPDKQDELNNEIREFVALVSYYQDESKASHRVRPYPDP